MPIRHSRGRLRRHLAATPSPSDGFAMRGRKLVDAERRSAECLARDQSNRLETDASLLIRRIASPKRGAMVMVRRLAQVFISGVASIESVTTMDLSLEALMRSTALPDSTPWVQ